MFREKPIIGMLLVSLSFCLLTCPGRMGSSDSYTQLQAAILLVQTGSPTTSDPQHFDYCSVPSPSGRFYQAHDPGNIILFIPAAVLSSISAGSAAIVEIPPLGKLATSLTYAFVGAALILAMFLLVRIHTTDALAGALTLILFIASPLWTYTRNTMDVLPSALGLALAMLVLQRQQLGQLGPQTTAILLTITLVLASWFRTSLLPFGLVSGGLVMLSQLPTQRLRAALIFGITALVGLVPLLVYNWCRSGNPLVLGTMHPRYADQNGFSGEVFTGLYGLLIAPNHGLLVFAPWILLILWPRFWMSLSNRDRRSFVILGLSFLGYLVMIASLKQWAKFEWGPRYLVPFLPWGLVLVARVFLSFLGRWVMLFSVLLVLAGLVVSIPAGLVNYQLVMANDPEAVNPLASRPVQVIAAYHTLDDGISGWRQPDRRLPDAAQLFPDSWLVRLAERGRSGLLVASGLTLTLVGSFCLGGYLLLRTRPSQS